MTPLRASFALAGVLPEKLVTPEFKNFDEKFDDRIKGTFLIKG